mgnify:CR=1 FL=1
MPQRDPVGDEWASIWIPTKPDEVGPFGSTAISNDSSCGRWPGILRSTLQDSPGTCERVGCRDGKWVGLWNVHQRHNANDPRYKIVENPLVWKEATSSAPGYWTGSCCNVGEGDTCKGFLPGTEQAQAAADQARSEMEANMKSALGSCRGIGGPDLLSCMNQRRADVFASYLRSKAEAGAAQAPSYKKTFASWADPSVKAQMKCVEAAKTQEQRDACAPGGGEGYAPRRSQGVRTGCRCPESFQLGALDLPHNFSPARCPYCSAKRTY